MDRIDWDALYMQMAFLMAMRSPDPSTQVGAVITTVDNTIVASGYNGWPRGIKPFDPSDERWERPHKYFWMAHAERNAIDNAARTGAPLDGCTLYTPIMPCADCARGIVQVGIKRVVCHEQAQREFTKRQVSNQAWVDGLVVTRRLFDEAEIRLDWSTFPCVPISIRLAGEVFAPTPALKRLAAIGPISADVVGPIQ